MREVLKLEGQSRESIGAVFYSIDYLLRLPEELKRQLVDTMRPILKEARQIMVQYERDDLPPTLAGWAEIELKEAMEKGKEENKKEIALTLLNEGFEVDYISKLTKLSVTEVNKLKES